MRKSRDLLFALIRVPCCRRSGYHGSPPGSIGGDRMVNGVRVEAHEFTVAHTLPGQAADEAPMRHDGHPRPIGQALRVAPEAAAALLELALALARRPPDLVDMIEDEPRPTAGQLAARRADVATEGGAL